MLTQVHYRFLSWARSSSLSRSKECVHARGPCNIS